MFNCLFNVSCAVILHIQKKYKFVFIGQLKSNQSVQLCT